MLSIGLADFTVSEPEDLIVATTNVIDIRNVLVTHELKMFAECKLFILQLNIVVTILVNTIRIEILCFSSATIRCGNDCSC